MSALAATGARTCAEALVWPAQQARPAPCLQACAAGNDVRQWIGLVAQRAILGLSDLQAYARAWRLITETNPFPATLGRICPHPCEAACNRTAKDGAVRVNAMERFLGDWALQHELPLARLEGRAGGASVGVLGAGPAGLSFAYQLARRGHRVTIYEKREYAGGMLRHGIPAFRLPKSVLQAEIDRIIKLGVELRLNTAVGQHVTVEELRKRHDVLFLGIGAGRAVALGVPGEDGPGVIAGIDFLDRVNRGEAMEAFQEVVVLGGGNTAVDAARAARRYGAQVMLLYRRTRAEMPAARSEVEAALAEGVTIEFLAAPMAIRRNASGPTAVVVQRMALGETDGSGRRRVVPVAGKTFEAPAQMVIAAVSQTIDWLGVEELEARALGRRDSQPGVLAEHVLGGGDVLQPGIAAAAIAQGRQAAEALHATLTSTVPLGTKSSNLDTAPDVSADFYPARAPVHVLERPVPERIRGPDVEVHETISEAAFLREAGRCFSCGQCHGCQYCFMFCNVGSFTPLERPWPGAYFALSLERCVGCGKCIELCPTGYLFAHADERTSVPDR